MEFVTQRWSEPFAGTTACIAGDVWMTDAQKVRVYEDNMLSMEGKVFYCEDDEGILRRWFPPRPLFKTSQKEQSE